MNRLNAIRGWNTMGKTLVCYIERVKGSIVKDKKIRYTIVDSMKTLLVRLRTEGERETLFYFTLT